MHRRIVDFIHTVSTHKRTLFGMALFVLLFSLVPLGIAKANIFSDIFSGIITIPIKSAALIPAVILAVTALATGILYTIFIVILGWLGTIALNVPVIPSEVGLVMEGWKITQGLANLFFILILVFIGLSTILRIGEYEAKKLLPRLIIVALLINFSPVLVGFVVDISNILTNVFLSSVSFGSIGGIWSIILGYFTETLSLMVKIGPLMDIIGSIIGTLILGVVITLFFGYAAWIYFMVVILLIARIIVLWILMILAPLAFLFYILPAGRKLAREWWQQLIQWSIIAIPIGFFLFLSFQVLKYTTQINDFFKIATLEGKVAAMEPGFALDFKGFFGTFSNMLGLMLAPLVSIVLLHVGYKLSKRYMPAAATQIIGTVEKGMKMIAGTALVATTGGVAAGLMAKGLAGMATKAQGIEKVLGGVGGGNFVGKTLKYGVGKPMSWATRGAERGLSPGLIEYAASKRRLQIPKTFDQMSEEELVGSKEGELGGWAKAKNLSSEHLIQLAAKMQQKKKYKHTTKTFKDNVNEAMGEASNQRWLLPDVAEILDITPEATTEKILLNIDPTKQGKIDEVAAEIEEQEKANPALQESNEKWRVANKKTTTDLAAARIYTSELKSGDIANVINPDSPAFAQALPNASSENLHRFIASFDQETVKSVLEAPGGLNDVSNTREKLVELQKSNPRLVRAIFNSPGYQHIDLAARQVLREEFGGKYEALEDAAKPPPPQEEVEEQEARITQQLTSVQTEELEPLQQRQTELQGQLDTAPNDRERKPIRGQINVVNNQTQKVRQKIQKLEDRLKTARENTALRKAPLEDLEREAKNLKGQIDQINARPVSERDYTQKDQLAERLMHVNKEIGSKTQTGVPSFSIPSYLAKEEIEIIQNIARAKHQENPARPVSEYEDEVRKEYQEKYRPKILTQLEKAGEEAWLKRRAQKEFQGNETQAYAARFRELFSSLRGQEEVPSITPSPTAKEMGDARALSQGKRNIPKELNEKSLRSVQLALQEFSSAIQKREQEITETVLGFEQRRNEGAPQEVLQELEAEITEREGELKDLLEREEALSQQELRIKTKLTGGGIPRTTRLSSLRAIREKTPPPPPPPAPPVAGGAPTPEEMAEHERRAIKRPRQTQKTQRAQQLIERLATHPLVRARFATQLQQNKEQGQDIEAQRKEEILRATDEYLEEQRLQAFREAAQSREAEGRGAEVVPPPQRKRRKKK